MFRLVAAGLLSACCALGCDMADYQQRQDKQRARLKIIDEENKHLGKPLEQPKLRDKDGTERPAWPVEVFLRLPKGVQDMPTEKEGVLPVRDIPGLVVVRYGPESEAEDRNVFVGLALIGTIKKDTDEELKTGLRLNPGQFQSAVVAAAQDFYRSERRGSILSYEAKTTRINIDVAIPDESKLTLLCDHFSFEGVVPKEKDKEAEGSVFHVYHHYREGRQIVVVFQGPSKNKDELAKAFEKSMSTLVLGEKAQARAEVHWKTHRK